jgi:hypothetical protein
MNPSDEMDAPVTRRELREELQQFELRLDERFRRYVNVVIENQRREIGGLDDKYSSLPAKTAALEESVADLAPRVAVLERKVFAPRARSTKRAARRRR